MDQYATNLFLNFTLILLSIIFLVLIIPWEGLRTTVVILGFMSLVYYAIYISLWDYSTSKYFCFDSPNKKVILVVEEVGMDLGGWCDIYYKTVPFFIKKLDQSFSINDSYRPFSDKDYKLNWKDDYTVEIIYGSGNRDGVSYKETVIIK